MLSRNSFLTFSSLVQGCSESRRLMSHYNYCATLDCPLCDSLQNRSGKLNKFQFLN